MAENQEAAAQAAAKSSTQRLDELFQPWNRSDAPGLVVGAALKGEVIYRRGFGMASLESAAANTPATRMRIGSTSKHFTCLLALLLAEEGKFDLDQPIRTYVAELSGPAGDPTLRQLMQHRGGGRCPLDLSFIAHGVSVATPKGEGLAALVRQTGRNFAPGEAMIYNNGGYHVISIAIERVGGAPFETQLHDRLFAPVGMAATASIPTDMEITPGIATMHVPAPGGGWRRGLFPSDDVRGEGAIVSTIDDMLRWMAHLRARDRFGTRASWEELVELPTYADGSNGRYALGLMIDRYRGLRTVHHAGGVFGGTSQMLTLPHEGLDVIIMINGAAGADAVRLAEQVVDIVLESKVGPEAPKAEAKNYPGMAGQWWSPETGMIYTLVDEDGLIKLSVGMPGAIELRPGRSGRVVLPASSIGEIAFDPEDLAETGELVVEFGGRAARHRRVARSGEGAAAFAAAALGRYRSADADAEATIRQQGEDLFIVVGDRMGQVEAKLDSLGPDLATTTPTNPLEMAYWAISLTDDGGRATGFRLNTMRTRGLAFDRLETPAG